MEVFKIVVSDSLFALRDAEKTNPEVVWNQIRVLQWVCSEQT